MHLELIINILLVTWLLLIAGLIAGLIAYRICSAIQANRRKKPRIYASWSIDDQGNIITKPKNDNDSNNPSKS